MKKEFYEILEINETATQEEIKKAYRKLAMKWHPDKWMSKGLAEREKASEEMRKINNAFEVLGDEEKRKVYDLGITSSSFGSYNDYEEIFNEIRRKEAELRKERKNEMDNIRKTLKLQKEELDRSSVINEISASFNFTLPRVLKEDLNKSLWEPYQDWKEKILKMEINIPEGRERSEELRIFKEEMIKAIGEAEGKKKQATEVSVKEKNVTSQIEKTRVRAIEYIEEAMKEKGLKVEDLGKYSNYKEQIDKLSTGKEVRGLRDKIEEFMNDYHLRMGNKNDDRFISNISSYYHTRIDDERVFSNPNEARNQEKEVSIDHQLITENNRLLERVSQLEECIRDLLRENEQLRAQIEIKK